jgi:homoserine kinase
MLRLRVPASSANLGPGFDCLGIALDLWNEVSFVPEGDRMIYEVKGEGAQSLHGSAENPLRRALLRAYEVCGSSPPPGLKIGAENGIPISSGLGSSAAAVLAGLCGANELLGRPLENQALLMLATELEGHPDNAAAALYGGLVVSVMDGDQIITHRFGAPQITAVIVVPEVDWPTGTARAVLPTSVSRADAVYNIGRAVLVVEALRSGDLELLQRAMDDRLHQAQRLRHIPGGEAARQAGRGFGAAALSGAGPSVIAFVAEEAAGAARDGMISAFEQAGVRARGFITWPSPDGVQRLSDS